MSDVPQPGDNRLSCEAIGALAFEYLDGEMPAEELSRLDAHLQRCPSCREYVERERGFLRTLKAGMAGERCPDVVRQRVREAMRARGESRSSS